jgi:hypothetical protein
MRVSLIGMGDQPSNSEVRAALQAYFRVLQSNPTAEEMAEGEDLWSNTLRRIFNDLRITQGTVDVAWRIPG